MRRLLILVALVAAALAVVSTIPEIESVSRPAEIPLGRMTLRDGRLFRAASERPFTGYAMEFYANGNRKSRSAVSKGLLHGLSQGWTPEGVLQVREHFLHGVSHGIRTKWHPNGIRQSQASILNGKLHGSFQRWDNQGKLIERIEMKNGVVITQPAFAQNASNR
jgi:hypothetical protein